MTDDMSGKFKKFSNLSSRHKRRRFDENVANRQAQQNLENSDSSEYESSEEIVNRNIVQLAFQVRMRMKSMTIFKILNFYGKKH